MYLTSSPIAVNAWARQAAKLYSGETVREGGLANQTIAPDYQAVVRALSEYRKGSANMKLLMVTQFRSLKIG